MLKRTAWLLLALAGITDCSGYVFYYTNNPSSGTPAAVISTNGFDNAHDVVCTQITAFSRWFDSFFEDPAYMEEEASARLSLRQSVKTSRELDDSFSTGISAALSMPRLSRRLKLMFEGQDDLIYDEEQDRPDLHSSLNDTFDSPSLGLQYSIAPGEKIQLDIHGGLRLKSAKLYIGPRLRYRRDFSDSFCIRITERLRWYERDGIRSKSELDLNQIVGENNLLRQRFSADWSEKRRSREGVRLTTTSMFTQFLKEKRALRYSLSSVYFTGGTKGWQSTTLETAWRQRFWRKWMILEVAPFLAWEKRIDWHTNPGVKVSLSVIFETKK